MSAVREGDQLADEAQAFTSKMRDGVITGPRAAGGVQGGAQAVQLQRKFSAREPFDDEMNARMQLMDKDGMTPFGQVYYDDKVGRWLQKKADVAETANLDAWFNKEFNKNNLADRQFAQQIYPQFYTEREKLLQERTQEVLNLKMIQLRGPRSKEDIYKLWLINTGRVVLPEDWDRIGSDPTKGVWDATTQDVQQKQFQSGLIRLPRFWTADQRKSNAGQLFARGLWGNEAASANQFPMEPPQVPDAQNRPLASAVGGRTLAGNLVDQMRAV